MNGDHDRERLYWAIPLVLIVAALFDRVVLPKSSNSYRQLVADLDAFEVALLESSKTDELTMDEPPLKRAVRSLGQPPFLSHGQRLREYKVVVKQGCAGPSQIPENNEPGTLIYCLAENKKQAWLTVVALGEGQLFGPPQVFHREGQVYVKRVLAPSERAGRPKTR
jgi:hypothetical protein